MTRIGLRHAVPALALAAAVACEDTTGPLAHDTSTLDTGLAAARGPRAKSSPPTGTRIGTLADANGPRTQHRIEFHNGQVMTSTSNVYFIWYGDWASHDPAAREVLTDFIVGLGGSPYFLTTALYGDASDHAPSGGLIYGGAITDLYSRSATLSLPDVAGVVQRALDMQELPVDPRGIYVVLTAPDVSVDGLQTEYCAMHQYFLRNGGPIKYALIGSPQRAPSACAPQMIGPNGTLAADAMASLIAAELANAVTDPILNAWYDRLGYEMADKCAWSYGSTYQAANGALANVRLGSRDFLLQQLWVPTKNGGHCALAAP